MNEKISIMIDGELAGDALDAELRSLDDDHLRTIERYQLIGALMRGESSTSAIRLCANGSAERISARIAEEPSWMLPAGRRDRRIRKAGRAPAFWGGFAAAATIAAVAIMVSPPNWIGSGIPEGATVAATGEGAVHSASANMDELNAYLVEHGEYTGTAGLNGLVAYAKFVSNGDR